MYTIVNCLKAMDNKKPYIVMIIVQFAYAGMSILSKAAMTEGMNPYVFVAYRQALATLALAPFAFFLERKTAPQLSLTLLIKIALVSTGITMSLNLFYVALKFVSATFATALTNTSPVITFVLAVCLRIESLSIRETHGVVKVIGSAISLLGALICTFARGPALYSDNADLHLPKQSYSKKDWVFGSFIILVANSTWCLWLIMQGPIIKQYPSKLRLVALQCFFSCVSSAVWAYGNERNIESWKINCNIDIFSVIYCGVIINAIAYWLQVWVSDKKGPVFAGSFGPLALVITAIFSAFVFREILHWGSVCGAILLVIGLYGILWGKSREEKAEEIKIEAEKEGGEKEEEDIC
ncbi:hypothetical protein CASFOL_016072 [Castilleja foliolosa]|uniref:WAT1-related protein n=1 Tax=Castilleja foliolosa TaxID=1961234 RepID=A0ABD3DJ15_9LAMI